MKEAVVLFLIGFVGLWIVAGSMLLFRFLEDVIENDYPKPVEDKKDKIT